MQHKKITVTGMVQGVGFRPAVAELAEVCGIYGQVKNMGGVVEILAAGSDEAMERFLHRLNALPGRIDAIKVVVEAEGTSLENYELMQEYHKRRTFEIVKSSREREEVRFLPVDFPTCDRCKAELFDKNNRRYRYPFISCTACGPRFSIQKSVPYDRESITMDDFVMCAECEQEYKEKGNIRRHAQTIACHACGPKLRLVLSNGGPTQEDTESILSYVISALRQDKIVAIKDIGGFHFAFSPMSAVAARRLREFKNRDNKPFAVMFPDMEAVREYCEVSQKEEELLTGIARSIVLLKKKKDFVPEICGASDRIGVLLPCNPLQILLLEEMGPLVMTSGNLGGEPIIISDDEMQRLVESGCPDMMLTHDREILTPLDDSIYQVNDKYVQVIRRARGLVPEPIEIKESLPSPVFAAGGDLKASFAYGQGKMIYLSQYFGDLVDVRCAKQRERERMRLKELLQIEPLISVGDMHPAYVSSQDTKKKIQHHMAHVASVIAEWQLQGVVLGIACDGTGFGCDGTIWGSEFFLYKEGKAEMKRVGHFSAVKLLGGDASAKESEKTLFSYMMSAVERGLLEEEQLQEVLLAGDEGIDSRLGMLDLQKKAWKQNINTAYSSSMGRLFDSVSALLGICSYNSYEGECAILLEQAAHIGQSLLENGKGSKQSPNLQGDWISDCAIRKEIEALRVDIQKENGIYIADSTKLLVDLWHLKKKYCMKEGWKEVLSYGFHHAVSLAIVAMAEGICKEYNESIQQVADNKREYLCEQIALSGGSFINRILLKEVADCLEKNGKAVYTNKKVPCGDGGIALGQAFLAGKE